VGVNVKVGVKVGVAVGVLVGVEVGVLVGVEVGVLVGVGVKVAVGVSEGFVKPSASMGAACLARLGDRVGNMSTVSINAAKITRMLRVHSHTG
jgi:NF-X1-type zinc finger protein NFXL1